MLSHLLAPLLACLAIYWLFPRSVDHLTIVHHTVQSYNMHLSDITLVYEEYNISKLCPVGQRTVCWCCWS